MAESLTRIFKWQMGSCVFCKVLAFGELNMLVNLQEAASERNNAVDLQLSYVTRVPGASSDMDLDLLVPCSMDCRCAMRILESTS